MNTFPSKSLSDNRKSEIENPKLSDSAQRAGKGGSGN